jgi:subfamily B ATP-binding cassette protein MsbA
MRSILRVCRDLFPRLGLPRWSVAVLLLLGLATALTEGLSISLLIPLLQPVPPDSSAHITRWLGRLFGDVPPESRGWVIGATIFAGVLLKNALSFCYTLLFQWLNAGANHQLRCGILREILRASQGWLDRQDSGRLLHALNHETWRANAAFAVLAGLFINVCMIAIFGVLLCLISWRLTLVTAGAMLVISWVIRTLTWRARRLGDLAAAANATMTQRAVDLFAGLRLVRTFGREAYEAERFEQSSEEVRRTFFNIDRVTSLVPPASEILTLLLLLGLFSSAASQPGALAGTLAFLVLLYRLHPRVRQLDLDRVTLSSLASAVEEVHALLLPEGKTYLTNGPAKLTGGPWDVRFEDVALRYETGATPALGGVTFTIPARRTTALIGPSGAGKSSVISLLCRFYDPTAGRVTVDGTALTALDLPWWRSRLAVVSQEVHLFNASVAENIAYGKLDATPAEIEDAARRAHAYDFIAALPQGFDTPLGERGLRLSGGQRQRLALARAFIRDPEVLILDEATNALDLISEQLVHDALQAFGGSRTVVIVAHRLSTVEHADHVVVLEAGHVAEQGSLPDLRAAGGLFARLEKLQFRERSPETELALPG